ncbi:UspA domain protein [Rubellimicrobium mesophilum DSM 19309]|uniref:UspA domain protein n=1 Tax=Rubellimicrobium mesophilum DSM 19309 TaxID=442562 RepID=A0A017HMY0_9RHOB|nr:universal stress protein [Rubellimicrobium mesophilum]EYD75670.1 UspA domain protein [Rubellimicrobium mesophilum DSM 19309]
MAIRTLSLVITDETGDAPALRAAIAIAAREDAQIDLFCLGIEPVPLETVPMTSTPMMMEDWRLESLERAQALASWARAQVPAGIRARVEPVTAQSLGLATALSRTARFSDLLVTGRPYGPAHDPLAPIVAEALLFGTGGPVLVVPDHARTDWDRPFRRICVAWNDGDEALRAVRAALPFLKAAETVDIAIVDPPLHAHDRADPGGALGLWLARHGVQAEIAVLARTEPRVADVLARFCQERGAEALVMGAFGHSRLREALLGGTTRAMLAAVPLPLLMAH